MLHNDALIALHEIVSTVLPQTCMLAKNALDCYQH